MTDIVTGNQIDIAAFDAGMSNDNKRKQLRGTRFADWVERGVQNTLTSAVGGIQAASQDQEGWHDDALRGIGAGAKWVGQKWQEGTADQEGIGDDILRSIGGGAKNTMRALDAASYYGGKVGGKLSEAAGFDPRIGGAIGNVAGDVLAGGVVAKVGKVGALKGAHQLVKADLPGSNLASKGLQRHYMGQAADLNRNRMKIMKQQVGGQSEAMKSGNLNLQASLRSIGADNVLPGGERNAVLKNLVQTNAPSKQIAGFLKEGPAKHLSPKYLDGRKGYYNAKRLSNNKPLLNNIVEKHDEVLAIHNKYKASPNINNQRILYDTIAKNYFSDAPLVYGKKPVRDKLVEASHWISKDEWHHIFGNKEAGEFLLTAVAQDPLVGINLHKHMKKLGITSSGVADNIAVMKETGHNNFHEFLKKMGMQEIYGRKAAATFEDYGQEISKAMTEGITYGPKMGDLAGTVVPPDPSLVNELFGMLDIYAKQNKFMRNILKKGEVTLDSTKNARRVTPKGDLTYDLKKSPSLLFKDRKPEVLGDRMRKIESIVAENK